MILDPKVQSILDILDGLPANDLFLVGQRIQNHIAELLSEARKDKSYRKYTSQERAAVTTLRDERVLAWCEANLREGDIVQVGGTYGGRKIRSLKFTDAKENGKVVGRRGQLEGFQVTFRMKREPPVPGSKTLGKKLGWEATETGIMTQNNVAKITKIYRPDEHGYLEAFSVNDLAKLQKSKKEKANG